MVKLVIARLSIVWGLGKLLLGTDKCSLCSLGEATDLSLQ